VSCASHEVQPVMVKGEMESDEYQQSQAEHVDGRPAEKQERKSLLVEPGNTRMQPRRLADGNVEKVP